MGNFRGNRYSRRHRDRDNMDPDRNVRQYWDFSFHEKGVYDVPASIDLILEHTGQADLLYVGHSMGTTAFFVMLSERPAYNVKVRAMVALAPVSFMTQVGGGGASACLVLGARLGGGAWRGRVAALPDLPSTRISAAGVKCKHGHAPAGMRQARGEA